MTTQKHIKVNALAGIENPQEFVDAAKLTRTMLQRVLDEICMTENGMRLVAPLTFEQARNSLTRAEEAFGGYND